MKLFDLHCDTLFRALDENKSIIDNNCHLSVLRGNRYDKWVQCFAIWIPDEYRKDAAFNLFKCAKLKFEKEINENQNLILHCKNSDDIINAIKNSKCAAILTVEGSAALAGDLNNLDYLKNCGVKIITLTWNGQCEVGGGALTTEKNGITNFGKEVVRKMAELSIVIDVSHASDNLFFDVINEVNIPIVASHSNSRTICNNKRNLTDEQFNIIKFREGLVGLNFANIFLREDKKASAYDIIKHADYFLSLGGEKTICIGSDFDGADMPEGILGIESIENLYELFLQHNYKESLVEDIFFNNAFNFLKKFG